MFQVDVEILRDEFEFKNYKIEEYESMLQVERQRLKDMGQEFQVLYVIMFIFFLNFFWRILKKINVSFFVCCLLRYKGYI